jgi:hypothetical protein
MSYLPKSRFGLFGILLIPLSLPVIAGTPVAASHGIECVRVGYSVGGLIPFPLVVAREKTLFEQFGLESQVVDFTIAREVFRELKTK